MESPANCHMTKKKPKMIKIFFLLIFGTTAILADKPSLIFVLQPLRKCPPFIIYNLDFLSVYCLRMQLRILPNGDSRILPAFVTSLVLKLLFVFIFAIRKLFSRILRMAFKITVSNEQLENTLDPVRGCGWCER